MAHSKRPVLWVVLPVYRDVPALKVLLERLREAIGAAPALAGFDTRFVAVDDSAGMDPEAGELPRLSGVTAITVPFNLGHQRAIVYGLRKLEGRIRDEDLVVTMDSDGEDRPEDLPAVLGPLLSDPPNLRRISLARRTRRRESLAFKALYLFYKPVFRLLTGVVVRTGNFAAYRGWFARNLIFHPAFDLCYSSSLLAVGGSLAVTEVPCPRGERYAGRSRMSFFRLIMHGIRMLMPLLDRIAARALIAFSAAFSAGLLLAGAVVGVRLFTDLAIPGWATFTLLLLLILSFVALGNFVILFALFSQSQGISLAFLDRSRGPGDEDAEIPEPGR